MRADLAIPGPIIGTLPTAPFLTAVQQTNAISPEAIDRAERAAGLSKERIDRVLLKLGLLDERAVADTWSRALGIPIVDAATLPQEPLALSGLPPRFLKRAGVLPIAVDDSSLRLAITDPLDEFSIKAIAARTGLTPECVLITQTDFQLAFSKLYPNEAEPAEPAPSIGSESPSMVGDLARLKDLATDAPAIKALESIIERAVAWRASDVHLTISRNGPRVRYRVDGLLRDVDPHSGELHAALLSRLKVLAELDIAERRVPQDGRIRLGICGREIDLRIATMPHLDGEGAVLRILDRSTAKLELRSLGFSAETKQSLLRISSEPHGLFLVTGPTGSGKTTTLYALLRHLVQPERNVVSVEDPVEYHLDGVTQIQVNRKSGLDFPIVLRAVLRQDPDVIMVGEIRDSETATIANQASLTGHLVLATLHTNSAAAAPPRLIDMGLEPYLLSSTIRGVLSQRLVRKLCPHCSRPAETGPSLAHIQRALHLGASPLPTTMREPGGCEHCGHTGYQGRTVISELMLADAAIRDTLRGCPDAAQIEKMAVNNGFTCILQDGLRKVVEGQTSPDELIRVLGGAP